MSTFVPREKLSKKARRQLDRAARRDWGDLRPTTRIVPSGKVYNRKKLRRDAHEDPSEFFVCLSIAFYP